MCCLTEIEIMKKSVFTSGLIAPIIYIFTVVLGGALWPGYSHARQPISELSMASAPKLALMDALFLAYNTLLFIFAVGVLRLATREQNAPLKVSGVFLVVCALSGMAMAFFRQDPIGAPATFSGTMHLALAAVASLSTILAIFFGAAGLGRMEETRSLRLFSRLMGLAVVVTGGLAAAGTSLFPQVFGILERLTIGAFMLWLMVISRRLMRMPESGSR